jgi:thiosulfate/3-mercaptopyruvate sulfurtransferase
MLAVLVLVGCTKRPPETNEYPRPELLVEPLALAKPGIAGQFIILDARDPKAFNVGRVPQARWVDAREWAKAFGSGKDVEVWGRKIGGLGIGPESKVIVYDDSSAKDAARIWWILRYWGVADVRLLDGGWTGWKAAELPIEGDKSSPVAPTVFEATPYAKRLTTKGQLLAVLKAKDLQIVDARSEAEFCGIDKLDNKRAGAVPGAKQLEWIDLIDKNTQRFKTTDQLRLLFQAAGIELDKPTVTHCQSGGRASVMAFAMELMGATEVSNYYAGWGEWGNSDDTPIVATPTNKR